MSASDALAVARDAVGTKFQGYSITTLDRVRGGLRTLADDALDDSKRIAAAANGRNLTRAQAADYDSATRRVEEAGKLLEAIGDQIEQLDRQAIAEGESGDTITYAGDGSGRQIGRRSKAPYRDGVPLQRDQSFSGFTTSRGLVQAGQEDLRLGHYIRGLVTGQWDGATAERRAMSEGTLAAGGHMVPTVLAAEIIDLARAQTRVLQAGARLLPMSNKTLVVPRWEGDPSMAWRAEAAAIAASDATLGAVTLTAKSLAGRIVLSRELLEDAPQLDAEIRGAFASALALEVDRVALYGTGTDPQPRGVRNAAGVTVAPLATNGAALANWGPLVNAVGALDDVNEKASGIIYSPRTARTLEGELTDANDQYLQPPPYLAGVPRYATTQVPNGLTVGTGEDTSDIFTADWSQLAVGVRTDLVLTVLAERHADTGQIGLVAWYRGDIAVMRPKAFHVTTGVLPAA